MTQKEKMLKVVGSLPDEATVEHAMKRLLLLLKVEKGIEQIERGQTISHSELKERMSDWLK